MRPKHLAVIALSSQLVTSGWAMGPGGSEFLGPPMAGEPGIAPGIAGARGDPVMAASMTGMSYHARSIEPIRSGSATVAASPQVNNAVRLYGRGNGIAMTCATTARDVMVATLAFIPDDASLGNLNVRRYHLSAPESRQTLGDMARTIDYNSAIQMLNIGINGMENSLIKGMAHSTSNEIAQKKFIAGRLDNYMAPGSARGGSLGIPLSAFLEFWNFAVLHNLAIGVINCMGRQSPVRPLWPTGQRVAS